MWDQVVTIMFEKVTLSDTEFHNILNSILEGELIVVNLNARTAESDFWSKSLNLPFCSMMYIFAILIIAEFNTLHYVV